MDEIEFDSILSAAQEGADWAWERIYAEYAGRVRGYIRRRGGEDPDDLLGEVFLQLARNIGTFRGTAAGFSSWVFTIAHHRVLDDHRRRRRRPTVPLEGSDAAAPQTPDTTSDEALDTVGTDRIQELLDRLSPAQRDALLLRIVGGLTVAEVAAIVGRREGAVKALQRRGLAALRRIIDREGVPL